jgi:hypothetical protein
MNKRRQKSYEVYLCILEHLEKTPCSIEEAIEQVSKNHQVTTIQKALFRKWHFNDLTNFGIGDRNQETSVIPDESLQNFRISTHGFRLWMNRAELLVLSSEIQAAIENPKLTRKIYESRLLSVGTKLTRPIETIRPAVSTAFPMVRTGDGSMPRTRRRMENLRAN